MTPFLGCSLKGEGQAIWILDPCMSKDGRASLTEAPGFPPLACHTGSGLLSSRLLGEIEKNIDYV